MTELLSLAEAQARVLDRVRPVRGEQVELAAAGGRFLVEDARALVDLPPFPSSAMDGFAVRSADTPGRFPIVARIAAGVPAPRALVSGEAMGIATGGVVPEGADAVIPIEYVVESDNGVEIPESVAELANVRPRGGDVRAGDVVVAAGMRLGSAQIGALAAAGIDRVLCSPTLQLAIVATGTELRPPGSVLAPGQVYEANGPMLAAALTAPGVEVRRYGAVADDEAAHLDVLTQALTADVVVTSGGVSVGPHDLVRRVLGELGVVEVFWGVAVKPGKPISFGVRGETYVFGLPGNPVSSLVGCQLFVLPAVRALQGASHPVPAYEVGRLATKVRRNAKRDEFLRARRTVTDEGVVLDPVQGQQSHMIARAASADALVLAPRGDGELAAGTPVRYLLLV